MSTSKCGPLTTTPVPFSDLDLPAQSLSCQCVGSYCDGPRGSNLGVLSVAWDSSVKFSVSFWLLNSSFPCVDKDSPSCIEALDDQKVEFLACGGSHTALLTKVSVPLSL